MTTRADSAGRLLAQLRARTTLDEGVGILRARRDCGPDQARTFLHDEHGDSGQAGEAGRMVGEVDSDAEGRSDPDWG